MRLVVLVAPLLVGLLLGTARAAEPPVRNVIVLVVDGCSSEQYTLARWFRGAALALDSIHVGAVKTWIADSVIADSAPAATAYATGCRTSDDLIGVGPHGKTLSVFPRPPAELVYRPLASVLEGARLSGKATG
ncbi:MAG: alkaline phosphatase, partial [Thermoguttaceae bacterium]|nr:alkaline phosphatase [Thermoguttaceae bacterium]